VLVEWQVSFKFGWARFKTYSRICNKHPFLDDSKLVTQGSRDSLRKVQ